jgi:hypothetical protein
MSYFCSSSKPQARKETVKNRHTDKGLKFKLPILLRGFAKDSFRALSALQLVQRSPVFMPQCTDAQQASSTKILHLFIFDA